MFVSRFESAKPMGCWGGAAGPAPRVETVPGSVRRRVGVRLMPASDFSHLFLEDPLGRNSCLFREERLFPSWGGNQLFAAEMFLLPRIFPFRNPVRQRLHILEELNIFVVYIGHFCLER